MTDEQINKLIHEKIRIKCSHESEAVGEIRHGGYYCRKCGSPDKLRRVPLEFDEPMPDYCTDLNAVALAEAKVIEASDGYQLSEELYYVTQQDDSRKGFSAFATARQRAEACLRTVDLWEEV